MVSQLINKWSFLLIHNEHLILASDITSHVLKWNDNLPATEHADRCEDAELASGGHRGERDGWAWSTPVVSTQLLILLKGY